VISSIDEPHPRIRGVFMSNIASSYLKPIDDGLAMRPAGTYAAENLDYLKQIIFA
jgi:hypothetical protein